MTEEQVLRQRLAELNNSYQEAAKPYIDRLLALQALKPTMRYFLLDGRFLPEAEKKNAQ